VRGYGWLPAGSRREAHFFALIEGADRIPEMIGASSDAEMCFDF
jgi:hypothetical protein